MPPAVRRTTRAARRWSLHMFPCGSAGSSECGTPAAAQSSRPTRTSGSSWRAARDALEVEPGLERRGQHDPGVVAAGDRHDVRPARPVGRAPPWRRPGGAPRPPRRARGPAAARAPPAESALARLVPSRQAHDRAGLDALDAGPHRVAVERPAAADEAGDRVEPQARRRRSSSRSAAALFENQRVPFDGRPRRAGRRPTGSVTSSSATSAWWYAADAKRPSIVSVQRSAGSRKKRASAGVASVGASSPVQRNGRPEKSAKRALARRGRTAGRRRGGPTPPRPGASVAAQDSTGRPGKNGSSRAGGGARLRPSATSAAGPQPTTKRFTSGARGAPQAGAGRDAASVPIAATQAGLAARARQLARDGRDRLAVGVGCRRGRGGRGAGRARVRGAGVAAAAGLLLGLLLARERVAVLLVARRSGRGQAGARQGRRTVAEHGYQTAARIAGRFLADDRWRHGRRLHSVGSRTAPRKVALVHDFLVDLRGADRVFLAIADIWPDAPIYTAVYDERGTEGRFAHRDVQDVVPPAAAAVRFDVPLAPAALPVGDRVVRPVRLRPRHLELERVGARGHLPRAHHARVLLLQPVPVRVERPRPDARGPAGPGLARGAARHPPPLAAVGLDRRPAGGPLPDDLADGARADPPLLGARRDDRASARRHGSGSRRRSRRATTCCSPS